MVCVENALIPLAYRDFEQESNRNNFSFGFCGRTACAMTVGAVLPGVLLPQSAVGQSSVGQHSSSRVLSVQKPQAADVVAAPIESNAGYSFSVPSGEATWTGVSHPVSLERSNMTEFSSVVVPFQLLEESLEDTQGEVEADLPTTHIVVNSP